MSVSARGLIACAVLVSVTMSLPLRGQSRDELEVRVYNMYGFRGEALASATQTATAILEAAGIRVRWRECRTPSGPSRASADTCTNVVRSTDVLVRLLRGGPEEQGRIVSLGY